MATVYALVFSINYPVTVGDFSSDCFSYGWPVEFDVPASPVNLYMYIDRIQYEGVVEPTNISDELSHVPSLKLYISHFSSPLKDL